MSADRDRATSHLVSTGSAEVAAQVKTSDPAQQGHEGHSMPITKAGDPMEMYPKDDPEKKKVPGYPQDMWMVMDEVIPPKPENYGLRKGWTRQLAAVIKQSDSQAHGPCGKSRGLSQTGCRPGVRSDL